MQDQGKRLLLAVAAALGVLLLFQYVFPHKEEPKPNANGSGSGATSAPVSAAQVRLDAGPCKGPVEAVPPPAEELIELKYPEFTAKFSNRGGELVSWQLADQRFQRDATKGELLPEHGKYPGWGAFGVAFTCDSTMNIPVGSEWKGERISDTQVRYTYPAKPTGSDPLVVEKTFKLDPQAFGVRMNVKVTAKVPAGKEVYQTMVLTSFEYQDPAKGEAGGSSQAMPRSWHSSTYRDGAVVTTPIKDLIKDRNSGMVAHEKNVRWSGFEHPYLLVAFAAKPDGTAYPFEKWATADDKGMMQEVLNFPRVTLKEGASVIEREVYGYIGPKNYKDLDRADGVAGFDPSFKATIDLGWFAFIGRPLMWLLLKFQSVVLNWGIAIVLLTFLVKGATLYWTTRSMRSMKAMAALGPELKALQAKYKDDKARIQAETMALYKQNGVNPIAGCLPILLQMPIWLALYRMLSSAGELYQQPFISGWIDDLTAPDPTHVLPAILVVTMFAQARLTPATGDSTQQKIMQYGMPLMFGVMSFFFPAGLTLYIFTNTLLSALHSIYMNKYDKKSIELSAKLKAAQDAHKAPDVTKGEKAADVKKVIADAKATAPKATDGDGDKTDNKSDKPRKRDKKR